MSVKEENCSVGRRENETDYTVINMDGIVSNHTQDTIYQNVDSSDTSHTDYDKYNSSSCTAVEDMEVDSDPKSTYIEETTHLFNLKSESATYGATKTSSSVEVDSPVSFNLQKTSGVVPNGSLEENSGSSNRQYSSGRNMGNPSDHNGNPLNTTLASLNPLYPTIMYHSVPPHGMTHSSNANRNSIVLARGKAKRAKAKERGITTSDQLPGFRGTQDVNELLEYIESSDTNGKKSQNKKAAVKNNGLPTRTKTKDRKNTKCRSLEALEQPEYDAQDSDNADSSPSAPDPQTPVRKKEQESTDLVEMEDIEFQTVTKKQRRKKRLVNGSSSPRRQQHRRSSGAVTAASNNKLVASVPPSEHSDVEDSDGGDSVHSLPVQHSAPLFPSSNDLPKNRKNDYPPLQPSSPSVIDPLESGFPPLPETEADTHFLSSTSLIYPTSYADIARLVRAGNSLELAAHLPVQCAVNSSVPLSRTSAGLLKRTASLPAADTPAVVIVGEPCPADVDVTFGFELNEQLLRLTLKNTTEEENISNHRIDFSARYREAPEVYNKLITQNSKEVIGFISEAWRRIEQKLLEQQEEHEKPAVRVYTLD